MQGHDHYVRRILRRLDSDPGATPLHLRDDPVPAGLLTAQVRSAAASMRQAGVGPGAAVAVLTNPNTPATLVFRYAANLLGATAVHLRGVNAADPRSELPLGAQQDILDDVRPALLAVDPDNLDRGRALVRAARNGVRLAAPGAHGTEVVDLTAVPAEEFDDRTAQQSEIAVVTYTSGSSGRPKGVSWSYAVKNEMIAMFEEHGRPATSLITAPLTHSSGFSADDTLIAGGRVVLHHGFDPEQVLRAVGRHGITRIVIGAPQVYALTEHPAFDRSDFSTVSELFYTGSPAAPERLAAAAKVLGPVLFQVYGTSETGLITLLLPGEHLEPDLRHTVGRPADGVRVEIRDPQSGRALPVGEAGEVCVLGRWKMSGYWNDERQTRHTVRDGWVRTGDIGHLDDAGYLHLHGRLGDVVKVLGVKVYPQAVESVLLDHPDVSQAAVFGVENADRLERVHAVVVPAPGRTPVPDELLAHVEANLGEGQVPATVSVRASLPLIGLAKPDRQLLRRQALAAGRWQATLSRVIEPALLAEAVAGADGSPVDAVEGTVEVPRGAVGRVGEGTEPAESVARGLWATLLSIVGVPSPVAFATRGAACAPPGETGAEAAAADVLRPLVVPVLPGDTLRAVVTRARSVEAGTDRNGLPGPEGGQILGEAMGRAFDTVLTLRPADAPALEPVPAAAAEVDVRWDTDADMQTLRLRLRVDPDRIGHVAAQSLHTAFAHLFHRWVEDPDQPVAAVDILGPDSRRRILADGDRTREAPPPRTLDQMWRDALERDPEQAAVSDAEQTFSYADTENRIAQLAGLLTELGAGPGELVALALPRSIDTVVAALAAARVGAAFLPVDPMYPAERIAWMLQDSDPRVVCTTGAVPVVTVGRARLLLDDPDVCRRLAEPAGAQGAVTRPPDTGLDDPAYVNYTSGTTGRPKGVEVTHAGLAGLGVAMMEGTGLTAGARMLQYASPSFDAFVAELAGALTAGAELVVAPPGTLAGDILAGVLRERQVTHAILPPVALGSIDPGAFPELRGLITAGEACPPELAERWSAGRRMVNAYGPTEVTVCATASGPLAGPGRPAIGRPIAGVRVHVLNPWLQPVPRGIRGELYVAGPNLARGYLNRPDVTMQRFVDDPFGPPDSRMYRTGDVVSWRANGELDFHGRADQQVKLRGHRIEPGETESVLGAHPGVERAVVRLRSDDDGRQRLVAWVVPAGADTPTWPQLRGHAARSLPEYMVPTGMVLVASLPMTPNGKLDEAALPAVPLPGETAPPSSADGGSAASGAPADARTTRAEQVLSDLFRQVLKASDINADSNFFILGGDSILAVSMIRLAREAGLAISPREITENPTVAALARVATPIAPAPASAALEGSDHESSHS